MDRFVHTAQTMADVSGMPGYPVVVLAHLLANNDDATLRVKAQEAVAEAYRTAEPHELMTQFLQRDRHPTDAR